MKIRIAGQAWHRAHAEEDGGIPVYERPKSRFGGSATSLRFAIPSNRSCREFEQ